MFLSPMNTPSPQPVDTIEKRRRQIEKAKAAHLSRQLQTRLQYARLKVDHGWQKQTLNEVENLYFHHYRTRAPPKSGVRKVEKSVSSVSIGTVATEPVGSATAGSSQSSNPGTKPTTSSPVVVTEGAPSVLQIPEEEEEQPVMDVEPPVDDSSLEKSVTDNVISPTVLAQTPQQSSQPVSSPAQPTSIPSTSETPQPAPSIQPSTVTNSPATPASQYALRNNYSQPSMGTSPSTRPSPSTSSSLPGANVALTYDNFWSSHNSNSNAHRYVLPPFTPADAAGIGLQNFAAAASYPFAVGSASSFQQLPFPKRPATVARKQRVGGGQDGG